MVELLTRFNYLERLNEDLPIFINSIEGDTRYIDFIHNGESFHYKITLQNPFEESHPFWSIYVFRGGLDNVVIKSDDMLGPFVTTSEPNSFKMNIDNILKEIKIFLDN